MRLLLLGLATSPIGLLIWLTFSRPIMRVSGIAPGLPVGSSSRLFEDPLCRLENLVITEIVTLKDDLLVGYRGGAGSWITVDPSEPDEVLVATDLRDAEGQLFLPMLVRDRRSMKLLHEWFGDQTRLDGVVARNHRVVALADKRHRNAVIAEFSSRL